MASKRISLKGKGADLFFGDFASAGAAPPPPPVEVDGEIADAATQPSVALGNVVPEDTIPAPPEPEPTGLGESDDPMIRSEQASTRASTLASKTDRVEEIRRIVKRPGKDVVYVRLTPEEKAQLADVAYAYKRRGIRTSDNELGRIAINSLLADHRDRGEESLLAKVLAALEA